MKKKYEFTGETKNLECGTTLKRIKRLSDGLVGGWIESERNLRHYGSCFVRDEAKVYGDAQVSENAEVSGRACVYDGAWVYDNASVSGDAEVYGNAFVYDHAEVYGHTKVSGDAEVSGYAKVYDKAEVSHNAEVSGNAQIFGNAKVKGLIQSCIIYKNNITMTDNHIAIGCENHTFKYWKDNIEKMGVKNDYSKKEIKAIRYILTGLSYMKSENTRKKYKEWLNEKKI